MVIIKDCFYTLSIASHKMNVQNPITIVDIKQKVIFVFLNDFCVRTYIITDEHMNNGIFQITASMKRLKLSSGLMANIPKNVIKI